jgi:hypothetical protein
MVVDSLNTLLLLNTQDPCGQDLLPTRYHIYKGENDSSRARDRVHRKPRRSIFSIGPIDPSPIATQPDHTSGTPFPSLPS